MPEPVATGEQIPSISERSMLEMCEEADKDFYSEEPEYTLQFSNGRKMKMPLEQGVYQP